jgi:hypothetical protein
MSLRSCKYHVPSLYDMFCTVCTLPHFVFLFGGNAGVNVKWMIPSFGFLIIGVITFVSPTGMRSFPFLQLI